MHIVYCPHRRNFKATIDPSKRPFGDMIPPDLFFFVDESALVFTGGYLVQQ